MTLTIIDTAIVAGYFVVILIIGLLFARKPLDEENYMLAARRLTLPAFMMTLVTTWYGLILGVGEFVFGFGVVAWVTNGLLWYIVYILFALFFAKKIRESNCLTIADQFRKKLGKKSAGFASVMTFIMTTPAPYVLSLAVVFNYLFGIAFWWSVIIGLFISALYIWMGGFHAVVKTDILQFVLMFLGFALLLHFSILEFGGLQFLKDSLPESHLTFKGELPWQTIVVWGFLACWTLVDPNFYQRCYAAKTGSIAKKGVLYSILFWFVFDMLTLFTGLYAAAGFPEADPLFSYLVLAEGVLPTFVKGLFVVSIISIVMSTIDSFLFSSSTIVAKDFLKSRFKNTSLKKLTRNGILITLLCSVIFILIFESIIGIIYAIGTVGVGALLIPILLLLFKKEVHFKDGTVFVSMLLSAVCSSVWLIEGWLKQEYGWPVYMFNVEPMYIGLAVSFVALAGMKLLRGKTH